MGLVAHYQAMAAAMVDGVCLERSTDSYVAMVLKYDNIVSRCVKTTFGEIFY